MTSLDHFAAIVGIDWADKKHDPCLRENGSDSVDFSVMAHNPQASMTGPTTCSSAFPISRSPFASSHVRCP